MPEERKKRRKDEESRSLQPEPLQHVMRSVNDLFHFPPVRGFLQTMDEFFNHPFPRVAFQLDFKETEDEYIISAELPGVNKEQIQIGIFSNRVVISVENREELTETDEAAGNFRRRMTKKLDSRSVSFPKPIIEHKAKATCKDGLLIIRLPIDKGKQLRID
ncbi:Hsp20/alpha crystallin family protein [Neobacillus notoginsengisoli]|uniref:Hsp20/alpha crystallin family protein n=1 Tax=Neobacillus notoginsengisoli TaxID=1578198 RepID=A0A417YVG2_9BACI|nr:Hsp20/alpha crystallin family protein [Neobacillus notoginsengisoli]RHW41291.1 Hsp20/alpha crystallin family protein [Neobacillus notoginsengisoli]